MQLRNKTNTENDRERRKSADILELEMQRSEDDEPKSKFRLSHEVWINKIVDLINGCIHSHIDITGNILKQLLSLITKFNSKSITLTLTPFNSSSPNRLIREINIDPLRFLSFRPSDTFCQFEQREKGSTQKSFSKVLFQTVSCFSSKWNQMRLSFLCTTHRYLHTSLIKVKLEPYPKSKIKII